MIIIPEIETVVIMVPRTGSGSLKRAIKKTYPKAMLLYRHMEAEGVPHGYDRWPKVGVVRNPLDRLWSLYKFLGRFGDGGKINSEGRRHDPTYVASLRRSVDRPFDDWIVHNEIVFTSPYDRTNQGRFFPHYTVLHPMPENRKSQWVYLRPDLGTQVYRYADQMGEFSDRLGVPLHEEAENLTASTPAPRISIEAANYMVERFAWDYNASAIPA